MLNHLRTLLLNLTYQMPSEHIPIGFQARSLPDDLLAMHQILFPFETTRYYRLFLVQNYLNIIRGAGFDDKVLEFDTRISYDLQNDQFFKIHRFSNPKISNTKFPLFPSGRMENADRSSYYYDSFLIRQVGSTANITIYSRVDGVYLDGSQTFTDAASAEISIVANGSVTEPIDIGKTGVSFVLGLGETFTSSSNKTWEFLVEAPYEFDFADTLERISILQPFKLFDKYGLDLTEFENIWNLHYNPVYRFSAFLLAFGKVINSL